MANEKDSSVLDSAGVDVHGWLDEIRDQLGWTERRAALRALHVLRDRLTVERNAPLSAQLPLIVRGLYSEGLFIDDGLATGASMHAALRALQQEHPAKLVGAVPIAPPDTCEALRRYADVVCCKKPEPFGGVGAWYMDFSQATDAELRNLLGQAAVGRAS